MTTLNIGVTGHRKYKLIKRYNDYIDVKTFIINKLDKELAIYKDKKIIFHLGLADGIDNIIGEYCIKNNIEYVLHIPEGEKGSENKENIKNYDDFENYFDEFLCGFEEAEEILLAFNIFINKLSKIGSVGKGYSGRNYEIVKNADILFSGWDGIDKRSGTYETICFAKEKGINIINLLDGLKIPDIN